MDGVARPRRIPSWRRRLLACAVLSAVPMATESLGGQEPDRPTPGAWQPPVYLDRGEAAALVQQLRAERSPLPDSMRRRLADISHRISGDPPGLRAPWGRPEPPCSPAGCALLIEELAGADPPLDAFSFAIRWALDPVAWSDSLLVRADTAGPMLNRATELARGALHPGSFPRALPRPDASWREWLAWPERFRSDRTAHYKLQLAEALTGRDIRAEIAAGYRNAVEDSARMALGSRAIALRVADVTVAGTLRHLASASPAIRELGFLEVGALLGDAQPLDPDDARSIQRHTLAILLDSAAPWPDHPYHLRIDRPGSRVHGSTRTMVNPTSQRSDARRPVLVVTDDLEPGAADPWRDADLSLVPRADLDSISDEREVSYVEVGRVVGIGPFAWVSASDGAAGPRDTGPDFFGYPAMVYRLTLLRAGDGWRLLSVVAIAGN